VAANRRALAFDGACEVGAAGTPAAPLRSERTAADSLDLRDELAASRRDLASLRQQLEALRLQDGLMRRRLARLENAIARARALAHHDDLTGLPNRRLLLDHFKQAVARAARTRKLVALLFLDLDGFKGINDALGHARGDRLLKEVAARLTASIRGSDTACRLGGDEFIVLLPDQECRETALAAAAHIRANLVPPYVLDGIATAMTVSMGLAVYPLDGETYGALIRFADGAMYRDKPLLTPRVA